MDNNEMINTRVYKAQQHVNETYKLLEEINLITPRSTFLDDVINQAMSKAANLGYSLGVAYKLTEKIEV